MRISDWSSDVCSSDLLPSDKMVSRKLGSDVQQRVIGDTEFSNLQLGFNFRFGEVAALRLGDIFWFRGAGTELESYIAILFGITAGNDLALLKTRSEEHTSELQSLMRISYAVILLKKKKEIDS